MSYTKCESGFCTYTTCTYISDKRSNSCENCQHRPQRLEVDSKQGSKKTVDGILSHLLYLCSEFAHFQQSKLNTESNCAAMMEQINCFNTHTLQLVSLNSIKQLS